MNLNENIRLSFENLKTNKLRSFLTMLGIIIGISAVITITTIGTSLQKTIAKTMQQLGNTNMIYAYVNVLYPDDMSDDDWDNWTYPEATEDEKLTYTKLKEIQEEFNGRIEHIIVTSSIGSGISYTGPEGTANVNITGVTDGYLDSNKYELISGRDISEDDNRDMRPTAVVSDLFVKYAYGGANPVGQAIDVAADDGTIQRYYVVGVYHYDKARMGYTGDATPEKDIATDIFTSYTFAYEIESSNSDVYYADDNGIQYFNVMAAEGEDASALATELTEYFNTNIYGASGNFELYCYDMASELSQIDQVLNILTIAISVIAAISLVVGGVGVMNIMLVSVVERTREIGIRKAMGAKNKAIQRQFLTEAVVICTLGGLIGIIVGVLNGFLLAQVAAMLASSYITDLGTLSVSVAPNGWAILISVAFSMLIGIIFGSYPAKRAAQMSPIDALRYE